MTEPRRFTFTVDSALLRELGERLVGKPHIALAELIKNSYDADASICEITFSDDSIEIVDNGHGMTLDEFRRYWMRVGTTHKQSQEVSRIYERPLTGSKGVGRLAVQFLASQVRIETTAEGADSRLIVDVDWDQAVQHELLTQAEAVYRESRGAGTYAADAPHGFRIKLTGLQQEWGEDELRSLAKEVWALRPPFAMVGEGAWGDDATNFHVNLETPDPELLEAFEEQSTALLEQWIARIEGRVHNGRQTNRQHVTITFADGSVARDSFRIDNCRIHNAQWEIRVFKLSGRLSDDVRVQEARDYLGQFGGVHVYDGAFRLPYYGIEQDWLGIEFDHSHRRVRSRLLPPEYHAERALNDLPTQGRILGVVKVNTNLEQRHSPQQERRRGDHLKIQVSRDRLVSNQAYEQLVSAVRSSIDYYAVESKRRRLEMTRRERPSGTSRESAERVRDVLSAHASAMPHEVYKDIEAKVGEFLDTSRREQAYRDALAAMLGPLATAGMSALAVEHETRRELSVLEGLADRLTSLPHQDEDAAEVASEIREWISRFRALRRVFEPMMNEEDREAIRPLRVLPVIRQVRSALEPFLDGIEFQIAIPRDHRLPAGTYAEWAGLFQNATTNALNAMVGRRRCIIKVSGGCGPGRKHWVRVSDTGSGIDLERAEQFFEPFRREGMIEAQRQAMGLGGQGLGLTIVRMIAEARGCRVGFVPPDDGFATTFELSWTGSNEQQG
ncbi:MAG TPA: ATP-binding protein [Magnetospirillum sp.]|nr:ATP-binding protein [Magnetospirillum sp.]